MKETQIRNLILGWLKDKGVYAFIHDSVGIYDPKLRCYRANHNVHRKRGVSDILGMIGTVARFLAIEVKSATGRLTPHQRAFIDDVNSRGGIAFVARSVDDVIRELKIHGIQFT